jgi:hypothetical protein
LKIEESDSFFESDDFLYFLLKETGFDDETNFNLRDGAGGDDDGSGF